MEQKNSDLPDWMLDDDKYLEAITSVTKMFVPSIIHRLLLDGKIDESRSTDKQYLISVVMNNLDVIDELKAIHEIVDQFEVSAIEAAESNQPMIATILTAITIEHILNNFYRDILMYKSLSSDEATQAIRSNIHIKLGWLMKLSTKHNLSDELKTLIIQVMDLRNSFIHDKKFSVPIDELTTKDSRILEIERLSLDVILSIPGKLRKELSAIEEDVIPFLHETKYLTKVFFDEIEE